MQKPEIKFAPSKNRLRGPLYRIKTTFPCRSLQLLYAS